MTAARCARAPDPSAPRVVARLFRPGDRDQPATQHILSPGPTSRPRAADAPDHTRGTFANSVRHRPVTRHARPRQLPMVPSHAFPTSEGQSDPPSLPLAFRCSRPRGQPLDQASSLDLLPHVRGRYESRRVGRDSVALSVARRRRSRGFAVCACLGAERIEVRSNAQESRTLLHRPLAGTFSLQQTFHAIQPGLNRWYSAKNWATPIVSSISASPLIISSPIARCDSPHTMKAPGP
jgi:hypothetical protein